MASTADKMANRIITQLAKVLDIDEDKLEYSSYRSTMGQNHSSLVISFTSSRAIDLTPLHNRYDVGDEVLRDKELERKLHFGGLTDDGLIFPMNGVSDGKPDIVFEN